MSSNECMNHQKFHNEASELESLGHNSQQVLASLQGLSHGARCSVDGLKTTIPKHLS